MQDVTKAQIKAIHTLKSRLNLPQDHYEAMLIRYGVESSKFLTSREATLLIKELKNLERKQLKEAVKSEDCKCSKSQLDWIADLWVKTSKDKDFEALRWFIKKITGKLYLYPETMTHKEANKVINALKEWKAKVHLRDGALAVTQ